MAKPLTVMVGAERFELPTSCSQSRRATRLRYAPSNKHKTYIYHLSLFIARCLLGHDLGGHCGNGCRNGGETADVEGAE